MQRRGFNNLSLGPGVTSLGARRNVSACRWHWLSSSPLLILPQTRLWRQCLRLPNKHGPQGLIGTPSSQCLPGAGTDVCLRRNQVSCVHTGMAISPCPSLGILAICLWQRRADSAAMDTQTMPADSPCWSFLRFVSPFRRLISFSLTTNIQAPWSNPSGRFR